MIWTCLSWLFPSYMNILSNYPWQEPSASSCLFYFVIQWPLTRYSSCPLSYLFHFFLFVSFALSLASWVFLCAYHSAWNVSIPSYGSSRKMRRMTCKSPPLKIFIDNWWRGICSAAMALTSESKIALHPRFVTSTPRPCIERRGCST